MYLTTGFIDNTYTITEVAPDFTVVSSVTTPLTDCTGPGFADFVSDPSVRYVAIGCNTNQKVVFKAY